MPPEELTATRAALDEAKRGAESLATRVAVLETQQHYEEQRRALADAELHKRLDDLAAGVGRLSGTVEKNHDELLEQLREVKPWTRFFDRVAAELSSWAVKAIVFALAIIALLAAAGVSPTWLVQRVITPPAAGGP